MLKLCDVSIEFSDRDKVICPVDHVSLEVKEGERHVIVGETGSGKSILLMAVLGLSGGKASGSILLNGRELMSLSQKEYARVRGREMAYIPQGSASGMDPLIKIGNQIGESLVVHLGVKKKEALTRAVKALGDLGFEEAAMWAGQYPHRLSGGMKQRALIAMGTIHESKLMLADEPTKGLDDSRRNEVEELFHGLSHTSILCVTHDLSFARAIGDRISVMYAGQLLETCTKDEFFRNPLHPYSQMMIRSLPEHGFWFPEGFAPSHMDYAVLGCRFARRCFRAGKSCRQCPPVKTLGERQVRCWYAD